MQGDPGFFGSIARGIGSLAKGAVRVAGAVAPGPVGMIARRVSTALTPSPSMMPTIMPGGTRTLGGVRAGVSPRGTFGMVRVGGRRMNFANAKAGRRAIRRITGLRGLLKSIESQLPRRPCTRLHRKK